MDIKSVLDERVIDLNMTAKNKKEAIEHLAGKLKDAGYIADVDSYIDDIYVIVELIKKYYLDLQKQTFWGYSYDALIGGLNNIHPSKVKQLNDAC